MAEKLRLSKGVVRVTRIEKDASGGTTSVTIYKKKGKGKKRKKSSYGLRTLDKTTKRLASAQSTASDSYLDRHKKSSRKKDGWLTDLPRNLARAGKKGDKKLKKN
jgi:uncharacterized protein DUF6312